MLSLRLPRFDLCLRTRRRFRLRPRDLRTLRLRRCLRFAESLLRRLTGLLAATRLRPRFTRRFALERLRRRLRALAVSDGERNVGALEEDAGALRRRRRAVVFLLELFLRRTPVVRRALERLRRVRLTGRFAATRRLRLRVTGLFAELLRFLLRTVVRLAAVRLVFLTRLRLRMGLAPVRLALRRRPRARSGRRRLRRAGRFGLETWPPLPPARLAAARFRAISAKRLRASSCFALGRVFFLILLVSLAERTRPAKAVRSELVSRRARAWRSFFERPPIAARAVGPWLRRLKAPRPLIAAIAVTPGFRCIPRGAA